MKKLISLALALLMILSLATVAFAEISEETTPTCDSDIKFTKQYKVNSGTAPAATFNFTVTGTGYKGFEDEDQSTLSSYPTITATAVTFNDKENGEETGTVATTGTAQSTLSFEIEDFDLGYYYYDIKENAGDLAGVTYATNTVKLVLQVVRDEEGNKHWYAGLYNEDEEKLTENSNAFVNEYNSGSLKVTKTITGSAANTSRAFDFTITFTAPAGKTWTNDVTATTNFTEENGTWKENTFTIKLSNNKYVEFTNLPVGTTYTVSEDADGYTPTWTYGNQAESKAITANTEDTVNVNNNLDETPEMGVYLEAAPYILLLAIVAVGMFVMLTKKRREY